MELELPAPGLAPGVSGIFVALAVLAGFAMPAMLSLRTVPPLRVLRQDAAPKAVPTAVSYGAAAGAVLGLLAWLVGIERDARRVGRRAWRAAPCCSMSRRSCSSGSLGRCAAARASRGVMGSRTSHAAAPTASRR